MIGSSQCSVGNTLQRCWRGYIQTYGTSEYVMCAKLEIDLTLVRVPGNTALAASRANSFDVCTEIDVEACF
jgi:hypothetical protein